MVSRGPMNGIRNEAGLVDKFLGSSYDIVKAVYLNLPTFVELHGVLEQIPALAQASVDAALEGALPADDANRAEAAAEAAQNSAANAATSQGQMAAGVAAAQQAAAAADTSADQAALSAAQAAANEGSASDGPVIGYIPVLSTTQPNSQIVFGYGNVRDSTNTRSIYRAIPMAKSITAPWVAGNGNGGRDSSAAYDPNETVHTFAIYNQASGLTDILFSRSPTAPILPYGYTYFRRIFSFILDAASNIRPFIFEDGWTFLKTRGIEWVAATNGVAAGTLRDIGVPKGLRLKVQFYYQSQNVGGTNPSPGMSGIYDPIVGVPQFGTGTQWAQIRASNNSPSERYVTKIIEQWCNLNAQVYTASNDTGDTIAGGVLGWYDPRKLIG